MLDLIFQIIIFYAPAYAANISNSLSYYLREKIHDPPLDGGRKFMDGKRILGDSRRVSEVLFAIPTALFVGFIEGLFFGSITFCILFGFLQGIGVIIGSIIWSFFKRRLNIAERKFIGPTIILDWTNHLLGATLFLLLLVKIEFLFFIYAFIFTLITHPILCYGGYKLGLKKVPW
jgi:CDP-2,3-bis-(O-geranylgeranyl)-sn-glycerol synthase